MKDDVLIRFEDGPMAGQGNIPNAAGGRDTVVPCDIYGWPLPARLKVLTHPGVEQVAIWDADDPTGSELPEEITNSPRAVTYLKISESRITDEEITKLTHVIRSATYRLEE